MKVSTTLVAIWSIYIVEQNVEALTCLKCDYVVQPRHCKTVTSCQDDDSCLVEKQINAFGETGYNLGCLAKRSCRNSTYSSSHCTQCCDKDLCNHVGCGEEGYPIQRGPVCYSCDNPLPEGRCHSIDVCREGEVCSLYGEDTFGTVLFTSGCMANVHCASHPGGVIIGRRSHVTSTLKRSHGLHDCLYCCDSDLCNKNCQTKVDGEWGSWTAWSLCTSHCNQTKTRVCDNPAPLHGGKDCHGLKMQTQGCYTDQCQMKDCSELLRSGEARLSGVYTITTPVNNAKIQVYCDMETDGGGWTVFQRRFNGSVDFYRNFSDYENGFGFVNAEHWLGLKYIHELASQGVNQLRIDIVRSNGSKGFDVYDKFSLGPGTTYTFHIGSRLRFSGCISLVEIGIGIPDGNSFSTHDHDTDKYSGSCARINHGGWWYNNCCNFNPNGLYQPGHRDINIMLYQNGEVGLSATTLMFKPI